MGNCNEHPGSRVWNQELSLEEIWAFWQRRDWWQLLIESTAPLEVTIMQQMKLELGCESVWGRLFYFPPPAVKPRCKYWDEFTWVPDALTASHIQGFNSLLCLQLFRGKKREKKSKTSVRGTKKMDEGRREYGGMKGSRARSKFSPQFAKQ